MSRATDTQTVETLYALGHWMLQQERNADGLHVFRTMLLGAPEDERSWLGLAQCHERLGQVEVARDLYALSESAVPGSFRCPLARARLARRMDDDDVAELAFDEAEARARALDEDAVADAIAWERGGAS